jgi:hypothetical protein
MTGRVGIRGRRLASALGAPSLAAICALAVTAPPAPALTPAPAPAWAVRSLPLPTHFAPGDESGQDRYEVTALNIGGASTNESPIHLTDVLPGGLGVKSIRFEFARSNGANLGGELCTTETVGSHQVVRCTVPSNFPGIEHPALLGPAEGLRLVIGISTPAEAEGTTLTNLVEVEGGGAAAAVSTSENEASSVPAKSGLLDFSASLLAPDGTPVRQAASTPFRYVTRFAANTERPGPAGAGITEFVPAGGDLKDIAVALPPGLIGNPTAVPTCPAQQFNTTDNTEIGASNVTRNQCPDGSAVGLVAVDQVEGKTAVGGNLVVPLYNLVPPPGMPAQLGFQLLGAPFYIDTAIRSDGDYGVTATLRNTTEIERVTAASVFIWGVPSDAIHNPLRGRCLAAGAGTIPLSLGSCSAGETPKPFLRLPTSCDNPLTTGMTFNTWTNPSSFAAGSFTEPPPQNCVPLDFSPTITAQPQTTVADSPSGLVFTLRSPQTSDPNLLAEADLRDARVSLPAGVTVNPASANGLSGCTPAQIGLTSAVGANPVTFDSAPAQCPDASKIGSVEIQTPLLDHPLEGAAYVASQNDNPFGSLLALYIAVDDPETGIVVKLAGEVVPDPVSGQLTTTFTNNPQIPFEQLTVTLFDGPRAALRTPSTCGTYTTETDLKPWSAPESGPDATPSDSFAVSTAPGGQPCADSESSLPHRPGFSAGTLVPVAGAFSPLVTRLDRDDGSQLLRGISVALPPGLLGHLAGVAYCPPEAIDAAGAKSGTEERRNPSCPAASEIGSVVAGAGAGPSPVQVRGKVYLAGPYKGAPLSLAIVTPAVAGPFDLGTVVVRATLQVDPETAQVTVSSDPLPTILRGIPLDLKSISVVADRPNFTLNPTNCEPKSIGGAAISAAGLAASLSDRFQVGGCRGLDFQPSLQTRLFGGTKRSRNPRFRAVLTPGAGEANIARAVVTLPHSEFLDQSHIRTVCTRVQFAAGQCPAGSVYGYARAFTPLLDQPLEGPVYLRSSSNKLPDLVVALRGQVNLNLVGRIDSARGGIRTTFEHVPDAPVSKFVLTMWGGKRGLLVNSRDICRRRSFLRVGFDGQNGKISHIKPELKNPCGKRGGRKGGAKQ